jgi:regulator of protease activity HflC (stomatin/prohibitin superfamily)
MKPAKSKPAETDANLFRQSPRFQRAAVHASHLYLQLGWICASAVLLMAAAWACARLGYSPIYQSVLLNSGAALSVLVIGLQSALRVSRWRERAGERVNRLAAAELPPADKKLRWEARVIHAAQRLRIHAYHILRKEEVLIATIAVLALWLVRRALDLSIPGATLGMPGYAAAGMLLCGAFGLLVLERFLAGRSAAEWPEAIHIAYLARAAVFTLTLGAVSLIFSADARLWPQRVAVLSGVVPAALALELLMRALYSALTRSPKDTEPAYLADTFIARLFTWPPRPLKNMQDELHQRFGIDLRQNWAFSFIRRASLPILALVVLIGWLLTGMRELPIASRGIYERFGKPAAVWDPGLHWGLPWPLARTLQVENGVVHEVSANLQSDSQYQPDSATADDPAPPSADRLWDVTHVAENAQVISSVAGTKQTFQVVNMDVRFVYRIGLTDEAVMAATYRCSDVEALIRATASQVMVHYFASRTLDGLLGEQRDAIASDIQRSVQEDLNRYGSGVELLSVLVESIHPPAGAAAAYHSVQAAQITAQAIVAQERGTAASTVNQARQTATMLQDSASAAARENIADAEIAKLSFDAEQDSFKDAGQAFVRERYFRQLAEGLSKANLVVIDHRIGSAGAAPTIDLRNFGASGYGYRP